MSGKIELYFSGWWQMFTDLCFCNCDFIKMAFLILLHFTTREKPLYVICNGFIATDLQTTYKF